MGNFLQDVRFALRTLKKHPGFTFVAIVAIAIAVGANTAIFSVVNGVLLKPLPYANPHRLHMVFLTNLEQSLLSMPFSMADFLDWRVQNRAFDKVAFYSNLGFNVTGDGVPEQIQGAIVSAEFFNVLGVQPELGRAFLPSEDQPGSPQQVVVSHGVWENRLKGDPRAIGKTITLNDRPFTVIGVMPRGFAFPRKTTEIWQSAILNPPTRRGPYAMWAIGRLKDGITSDQAQMELDSIARQLAEANPQSNSSTGIRLQSIDEFLVGNMRTPLYVLFGAVGFILLIACVNVANLLLARATAREKEVAVRAALGASRGQLIRQLLTESLVLAALGGAAGLVLSIWCLDLLKGLAPANVPGIDEIVMDRTVLLFAMAVSLVSGLIFGLVPALQISAANLNESLKEGGRSGSEQGTRRRIRSALVIAEVALSLMLLTGAGLMIKSFNRLSEIAPGVNPTNVLTVRAMLSRAKYENDEKLTAFYDQFLTGIRGLPGVQAAGMTNSLPPNQLALSDSFTIEGQAQDSDNPEIVPVLFVSSGYFEALQIPVLRGRAYTDQDRMGAPRTVIINDALAQKYLPNQNPVGKRMKVGGAERPRNEFMEIIGVVGNVKYEGLAEQVGPAFYLSHLQILPADFDLVIKTASDPLLVANAVKEELWKLDKDVPVVRAATMNQRMSEALEAPRFRTLLLGAFAGVALLLAAVGIYGVVSYSVTLRTHEIGVRISLGAGRKDVLRMVLSEGLILAIIGVGIGLIGAVAVTRVMRTLLYEVTPTDPLTFTLVSLVLIAIAAIACYIPARRAMRVDPMIALRYE